MIRLYFGFVILFALVFMGCEEKTAPDNIKPSDVPQPAPIEQSPLDSLLNVPQTHIEISTPVGKMVIALYSDTPKHREMFLQRIQENALQGTMFHRVVQDLMIQGGDPKSKALPIQDDGSRDTSFTIASEILPYRFHKRGAIGAVRLPDTPNGQDEPQFYIISASQPIPQKVLLEQEQQIRNTIGDSNFNFSDLAKSHYLQNGGAPWLDMQFTVFGEIVQGFEVLDKLSNLETPRKLNRKEKDLSLIDRPINIRQTKMKMRVLGDFKPKNTQSIKIEPTKKLIIDN